MAIRKREDIIETFKGQVWRTQERNAGHKLYYAVDSLKGNKAEHVAWIQQQGIDPFDYWAPGGYVMFKHDADATLFYLTWGK